MVNARENMYFVDIVYLNQKLQVQNRHGNLKHKNRLLACN